MTCPVFLPPPPPQEAASLFSTSYRTSFFPKASHAYSPTEALHTFTTMSQKNITRYTYENTDFQGWRVSIQRCGRIITKYFSDLQCGSTERAHQMALDYRDRILAELASHQKDIPEFMDRELARIQQELQDKYRGNDYPGVHWLGERPL